MRTRVPATSLLFVTLGWALGGAAPAGAETGRVLAGHTATSLGIGVSENAATCRPGAPYDHLDGIDGKWFEIPAGATSVTVAPSELLDVDVYFYVRSDDEPCTYVPGDLADAGIGQAESGPIPTTGEDHDLGPGLGATHLVASGAIGTGEVTVTFDVPAPADPPPAA